MMMNKSIWTNPFTVAPVLAVDGAIKIKEKDISQESLSSEVSKVSEVSEESRESLSSEVSKVSKVSSEVFEDEPQSRLLVGDLDNEIPLLVDDSYFKSEYNIPSDDFWYPPFLLGEWSVDFHFKEAMFTTLFDLPQLLKQGELPGISQYSIFMFPDIGSDVSNVNMRWVELDGHPREDHPFNMRNIVKAFSTNKDENKIPITIDDASYSFQKAPDWFHSPANKWDIIYHDDDDDTITDNNIENKKNKIHLRTQKRSIQTFAGTVQTTEFFRQEHVRNNNAGKEKKYMTDYALNWRFSVPASLRDEFVTVDELRKSQTLKGRLNIFAYLQPTNDLYLKLGGHPAAVYSYDLDLTRVNANSNDKKNNKNNGMTKEDVKKVLYPFVWRDKGPVELQRFFGY